MCDNHKSEKYAKKEKENIKLRIPMNSIKKKNFQLFHDLSVIIFFSYNFYGSILGGVCGGGVEDAGMLPPPPGTTTPTLLNCQRFQYIIHYCTLRVSIILLCCEG